MFFPFNYLVIAAACIAVFRIKIILLGREKLINGEADPFKKITGIVRSGSNALLFGNAEIICRNEELNITLQLDYSEQTKRNINSALLIPSKNKTVVKYSSYAIGNVSEVNSIIVGILAAAVVDLREFCSQTDRVNNLCWCHKELRLHVQISRQTLF